MEKYLMLIIFSLFELCLVISLGFIDIIPINYDSTNTDMDLSTYDSRGNTFFTRIINNIMEVQFIGAFLSFIAAIIVLLIVMIVADYVRGVQGG